MLRAQPTVPGEALREAGPAGAERLDAVGERYVRGHRQPRVRQSSPTPKVGSTHFTSEDTRAAPLATFIKIQKGRWGPDPGDLSPRLRPVSPHHTAFR